ncbi:hypothetical protein GCM10010176_004870 [Nonomuraea spiralis]|nr:hypothetical protein GCM10010176_004870 [Nonomuraea spiralis]
MDRRWRLTAAALAPSAAHAADSCWPIPDNTKTFYPPGRGPVLVAVKVCVGKSGTKHEAQVNVAWSRPNGGPLNAFDDFLVHTRLERNDVAKDQAHVGLTYLINSKSGGQQEANGKWYDSPLTGGWTADVTIDDDLDNDGKGEFVWNLPGSHEVSLDGVE